ncbi:MAG: M43 family zinc metalloprotease, partial [Bacteroidota bacterium]
MNAIRLLFMSWAYVACLSPSFAIPGFPQQSPVPSEVIFVPVVVHLVHDPLHSPQTKAELEALVAPQIKRLNADFSRRNANFYDQRYMPEALRDKMGAAMIQFYLAPAQPNGTSTTLAKTGSSLPGVTYRASRLASFPPNDGPGFYRALKSAKHGQKAWDPTRYLNIWVAEIEEYSGVAQYPWQYHLGPQWQEADGVVIDIAAFGVKEPARSARDGGRTLTHEIGHWLGLLHPFHEEGGHRDDFLADTPIPQQQNAAHYTWDAAPPALQPDDATAHKGKAFFMNFMDYAWDHCRNSFTHGQVQRMRSAFELPHIGIRQFSPKEVKGSRSYFQFPNIRPVSGRSFLCQGKERVFTAPSDGVL